MSYGKSHVVPFSSATVEYIYSALDTADGLYIDRPLDHDFYPKSELLLSAKKILDLAESPEWGPAYREHGEGGMG